MKIYVLSDSHNSFNFSPFLEICRDADMVIHCGDGERDVADLKSVLSCPVYAVKGNCDFFGKKEEIIDIGEHRIFVTHGDIYGVKYTNSGLLVRAKQENADIVLYGHTHLPDINLCENIWVINPGSLTRPRDNNVSTYCILELENKRVNASLIEFQGQIK